MPGWARSFGRTKSPSSKRTCPVFSPAAHRHSHTHSCVATGHVTFVTKSLAPIETRLSPAALLVSLCSLHVVLLRTVYALNNSPAETSSEDKGWNNLSFNPCNHSRRDHHRQQEDYRTPSYYNCQKKTPATLPPICRVVTFPLPKNVFF